MSNEQQMTFSTNLSCLRLLIVLIDLISLQSFQFSNRRFHRCQNDLKAANSFVLKEHRQIECDVCVLGGGPAGMAMAWLLQEREQCNVVIVDPKGDQERTWYPNYGEWREEWHCLAERLQLPEMKKCTTTEWEYTDCFFGGSYGIPMEQRLTLPRPYVRVDRVSLQKLFRSRFLGSKGRIIPSTVNAQQISCNIYDKNIVHNAEGSTICLDNSDVIRSKMIIDATGFESQLVAKEDPYTAGRSKHLPIGYQIAYGFIATVDSLGPYDERAMTLFDYRTDHITNATWLKDVKSRPTFMYVMPLSKDPVTGTYRMFWEETSLVGKGTRRLSFEECKQRALTRLQYHNIKILGVEEEEYCYIPMGGELPDSRQRIVPFGAAANLVHPSTGYHVCRMLAAASDVSRAVGKGIREKQVPDQIAANSYKSLWNQQNRGQRDFQVYGGEFLMAQKVKGLRGFFQAFFSLEQIVWAGFLAGWPGLPGNTYHESWDRRLLFALQMFVQLPNEVRLSMMLFAIRYTFEYGPNALLRSLTPSFFFGRGPPEPAYIASQSSRDQGEFDAKEEARKMMKKFLPFPIADKGIHSEEVQLSDFPAPFDRV